MNEVVKKVESIYLKRALPGEFKVGDTVRVHYRIVEGEKSRIQVFEGIVISIRGSGAGKSFTVRRESYGVGIERIFPMYSPNVEKVEVVRIGKVRRAKLYFLRKYKGKEAIAMVREIKPWEQKKK
ncbi:MAG: 50S ribosomal protein L19 [Aquificaceae bacterium]|nr:50S ribosomal protein L19 [Aquificaceae bacterium]MDW8237144.1 50S ribosomal protein L19 [Aquificaceae bacterium]